MTTFRGGSIADRPAYLNRNEEWVRKLKKREALDIDQAKALIGFYFQELYGRTPHCGLHNQKPFELFKANPAPEDRQTDASELNFLMLKADSRKVGNNGIRLNNALYWHDDTHSVFRHRQVEASAIAKLNLAGARACGCYPTASSVRRPCGS